MFTRNLSCKNAWGLHNGGFQKKQSTSLDNSNRCDRIELPQLFLQHVSLLNGSDIISLPSICHSKLHRLLKQNIGLFCWGIQKSVIFRCKSYFLHKYDRYTRHFIDFRHNILTDIASISFKTLESPSLLHRILILQWPTNLKKKYVPFFYFPARNIDRKKKYEQG